jgi:hypothetical protein
VPARLSVHLPDDAARLRVLEPGVTLSIGRDPGCDLVLDHPSVSRRHAALSERDGSWELADLGSKNGVRVGGIRVERTPLRDGDWFSVGDVFCQFERVAEAAEAAQQARAERQRSNSRAWEARIRGAADIDRMLAEILRAVVDLSECRRGFLLAGNPATGMRVRACFEVVPEALQGDAFQGSSGAIERCLRERRAVFLAAARDRMWLRGRASIIAQGLRAIVAVPLEHDGRLLGVVYADSDDADKLFTELDAELLRVLAAHAAIALAASGVEQALNRIERWIAVDASEQRLGTGPAPSWAMLGTEPTSG